MALFSAFYNTRFFGKGKVPWPKPHPHVRWVVSCEAAQETDNIYRHTNDFCYI